MVVAEAAVVLVVAAVAPLEPTLEVRGNSKVRCQICHRPNHTAIECCYRFEEDFQPNSNKNAGYSVAYGVDTNWYADSGASITSQESWNN
jgi:hypothetical protein